ncbi:hypothetical protein K9L16_03250 [Candidatus Pacearchaeota archaeon]|nr:hypothetical protein [Candidatus Pacearchaeota archaeon]
MEEEELQIIEQLANSLDEAIIKLEKAYEEKDSKEFNEIKKLILKLNNEIGINLE